MKTVERGRGIFDHVRTATTPAAELSNTATAPPARSATTVVAPPLKPVFTRVNSESLPQIRFVISLNPAATFFLSSAWHILERKNALDWAASLPCRSGRQHHRGVHARRDVQFTPKKRTLGDQTRGLRGVCTGGTRPRQRDVGCGLLPLFACLGMTKLGASRGQHLRFLISATTDQRLRPGANGLTFALGVPWLSRGPWQRPSRTIRAPWHSPAPRQDRSRKTHRG